MRVEFFYNGRKIGRIGKMLFRKEKESKFDSKMSREVLTGAV
jgi:hypothetical protein